MPRHCFLALVLPALLVPLPSLAQSATAPFDPVTVSPSVEIGPVAGLTTAWHPAPKETGVPLGTTVQLRVRVTPGADAVWSGAQEIETRQGRSVAELRLDGPGLRSVEVQIVGTDDGPVTETLRFEAVDLGAGLRVGRPHLAVEPIVIDEGNPNASTMALYFQGSSIAALTELAPGAYRTSTNRWVTLEADVVPAALAPLVEWRLDGKVLKDLGARVRLQVFTIGPHALTAGTSDTTSLDTYMVHITHPTADSPILDGESVTFRAVTEPPGLEPEITWLASTKYGDCAPMLGRGAEFTTRFDATVSLGGRWLGVRADNALVGRDAKGSQLPEPTIVASPGKVEVSFQLGSSLNRFEITAPEADCLGSDCRVALVTLRVGNEPPRANLTYFQEGADITTGFRSSASERSLLIGACDPFGPDGRGFPDLSGTDALFRIPRPFLPFPCPWHCPVIPVPGGPCGPVELPFVYYMASEDTSLNRIITEPEELLNFQTGISGVLEQDHAPDLETLHAFEVLNAVVFQNNEQSAVFSAAAAQAGVQNPLQGEPDTQEKLERWCDVADAACSLAGEIAPQFISRPVCALALAWHIGTELFSAFD